MFPVRVVVETVRDTECVGCAESGPVLADSYAIVSGHTSLSQLVDTVLAALGLQQLAYGAKGMVQLNNWKPLPFDKITDNQDASVETLLKDVSNHLTLKILTKHPEARAAVNRSDLRADSTTAECVADMKDRLLKAAVNRHPQILASIKNHQLKDLVVQVLAGDAPAVISRDQLHGFNHWLDELSNGKSTATNGDRSSPPALGATTRFNQLLEQPKLERWFREDPNPSRQKLLNYMNLLNASNFRRHHNKITYQQICNWFSNARAVHRQRTDGSPMTNGLKLMNGEVRNTKFDFNSLLSRQQQSADVTVEGMNVSSESPVPVDDGNSGHSASENGDEQDNGLKQESTSSPDLSVDLNMNGSAASTMSVSPKPRVTPSSGQAPVGGLAPGIARSRLMFDPLTELPLLEKWFEENPHPSWIQIDQYTETLNSYPYRQSYPPISTHNVKIWFKNRRAKCKRMLGTDVPSK